MNNFLTIHTGKPEQELFLQTKLPIVQMMERGTDEEVMRQKQVSADTNLFDKLSVLLRQWLNVVFIFIHSTLQFSVFFQRTHVFRFKLQNKTI